MDVQRLILHFWTPWTGFVTSPFIAVIETLNSIFVSFLWYIMCWLDPQHAQSQKANLTILFDKCVPYSLMRVRCNLRTIMPIPENSMWQVRTILDFHRLNVMATSVFVESFFFLFCLLLLIQTCSF